MEHSFCFSVLALGTKYHLLAQKFADNLILHSPQTTVVVGTDNPRAFANCPNVEAFKLNKKGMLHCYHDKRFVIERALSKFSLVIQIDADTEIIGSLPASIDHSSGLAGSFVEGLVEHVQKYSPERMRYLRKLADKLAVDIDAVSFVGEALFAVSAEGPKTAEFLKQWNLLARYLELHGIHAGEGNAIGLAAAKAGLAIHQPEWMQQLSQVSHHLDASKSRPIESSWNRFRKRVDYHYRFNKARVNALRDFGFYYR
jgi:hypothetical protein